MVLSRPRTGKVVRARDMQRVVDRVACSQSPSHQSLITEAGALSLTAGSPAVRLFELIEDTWESIIPPGGTTAVLAARARPVIKLKAGWYRIDGERTVAIWWPSGGSWPQGYQVPVHVRRCHAVERGGYWELISNSQPVFRIELRSAFSGGQAAARFVTANGGVIENSPITVNDPLGMYIGGAYKRGYAVFMPDAQRLEVIQLEC